MSETCETCKHALAVDPKGTWRMRAGCEDWPKTHIHCALYDYPKTHVIRMTAPCTHLPSKWEEKSTYEYGSI